MQGMELSNLIVAALFPAILAGCGSAYSGLTHWRSGPLGPDSWVELI